MTPCWETGAEGRANGVKLTISLNLVQFVRSIKTIRQDRKFCSKLTTVQLWTSQDHKCLPDPQYCTMSLLLIQVLTRSLQTVSREAVVLSASICATMGQRYEQLVMPRQSFVSCNYEASVQDTATFSGIILRLAFRQDYTDHEKLFRTASNFTHHIHARAIVLIYWNLTSALPDVAVITRRERGCLWTPEPGARHRHKTIKYLLPFDCDQPFHKSNTWSIFSTMAADGTRLIDRLPPAPRPCHLAVLGLGLPRSGTKCTMFHMTLQILCWSLTWWGQPSGWHWTYLAYLRTIQWMPCRTATFPSGTRRWQLGTAVSRHPTTLMTGQRFYGVTRELSTGPPCSSWRNGSRRTQRRKSSSTSGHSRTGTAPSAARACS